MNDDKEYSEILTNRPFSEKHKEVRKRFETIRDELEGMGGEGFMIAMNLPCDHEEDTGPCSGTRTQALIEGDEGTIQKIFAHIMQSDGIRDTIFDAMLDATLIAKETKEYEDS